MFGTPPSRTVVGEWNYCDNVWLVIVTLLSYKFYYNVFSVTADIIDIEWLTGNCLFNVYVRTTIVNLCVLPVLCTVVIEGMCF